MKHNKRGYKIVSSIDGTEQAQLKQEYERQKLKTGDLMRVGLTYEQFVHSV